MFAMPILNPLPISGVLLALSIVSPATAANHAENDLTRRAAACIACHATDSSTRNDAYFPRLSGKPEAYLYKQLRYFRDGKRQHPLMVHMVSNLSDAYLAELAHFFATRHAPYTYQPQAVTDQALFARGRALVLQGDPQKQIPACTACHGQDLRGRQTIPGLLGLPQAYLNAQLGAWRSGVRSSAAPDCMAQIVGRMQAGEIEAVTAYLAAQALPAAQVQTAESRAKPEEKPARLPLPCGAQEEK